ncbi:hypothetical protein M0804_001663 [Polistes exclamans]|nr:hypothetical protein M0804_001663 [Polistes exclamans]
MVFTSGAILAGISTGTELENGHDDCIKSWEIENKTATSYELLGRSRVIVSEEGRGCQGVSPPPPPPPPPPTPTLPYFLRAVTDIRRNF